MSLEPDLVGLLSQEVTIEPFSGEDAWGNKTYITTAPSAFTVPARVVHRRRKALNQQGIEVLSEVTIYADTTRRISVDDRLTLPDIYVPRQPRIISAKLVTDEDGPHHTVINA